MGLFGLLAGFVLLQVYINFPDDFDGNPLASGTYTVVFYANGVIIERDKFRFLP